MKLSEVQKIEIDMLGIIHNICTENNLDYWLAYGSVLGAVRHNGPIPWDSDSDLYIKGADYIKTIKTIEANLPEKYCLYGPSPNSDYRYLFYRVGLHGKTSDFVHVDLFPLIKVHDNIFFQRFDNLCLKMKIKQYWIVSKNIAAMPFSARKVAAYIARVLMCFFSKTSVMNSFERKCKKLGKISSKNYVVPGYYDLHSIDFFDGYNTVLYDKIQLRIPIHYEEYLKQFYGNYMEYPEEEYRNKMMLEEFDEKDLI